MAEIRDVEGNPLVRGEAAMAYVFSNQFVALSEAAGRPLKLVSLPRIKKDGPLALSIMSSQMFSIAKASRKKRQRPGFSTSLSTTSTPT